MKRNRGKQPFKDSKKWTATQTRKLEYNIPHPETLHNIGIKHWGLDKWKKAFNKLLEEIEETADLFEPDPKRRSK